MRVRLFLDRCHRRPTYHRRSPFDGLLRPRLILLVKISARLAIIPRPPVRRKFL